MPNLGSMGEAVGGLLKSREETIAIAESSAGGLISSALLSVPGASAYFLGGGVLYTYESRHKLLALPEDAFEGLRPSTEEYALRMARAVRDHLGATWGVGETGAAGPTGNRYGDAAGHACIAVAGPADEAITLETGSADREANMWAFTNAALELLESTIKKNG
ncbi:MAG: CinA family protein [bacterium]